MKKSIYFYSYLGSIACFVLFLLLMFWSKPFAGWLLTASLSLLAIAMKGSEKTSGLSFTIIIFAAVATTLFYPQYFTEWGGYKLSNLIIPLIQLIMFGMGTGMSLKDFAGVVKSPKGVFIGVASQFIIMPLLGFTLSTISGLPPEIAAGIILIGCSPSGLASNVMAYMANANLALSITITSITTLLAPLITPLLMKVLAGALIEIDVLKMMWDIFKMIIIPIGAGLVFNKLMQGKSEWLHKLMPKVSMFGIAFIITIITAAGRESLIRIGPWLIFLVLVHNLSGYLLGYWSARLFKMPESDCRTVAIEVGMQNAGLASGIAKELGRLATLGLASAVFGPVMNITGSMLASWWQKRKPANNDSVKHTE